MECVMGIEFPSRLEIDHHIPIFDVRLSAPNVDSFVRYRPDLFCPLSRGNLVYNHPESRFEGFVRHVSHWAMSAAKPMTVFSIEFLRSSTLSVSTALTQSLGKTVSN